jgi:hypothetical protein
MFELPVTFIESVTYAMVAMFVKDKKLNCCQSLLNLIIFLKPIHSLLRRHCVSGRAAFPFCYRMHIPRQRLASVFE